MPPKRRLTDDQAMERVGDSLLSPYDIRRMRERMGMFQRDLAEALMLSPRTVEGWESGRRSISRSHAGLLYSLHKKCMEGDYAPLKPRDPRKRILRRHIV